MLRMNSTANEIAAFSRANFFITKKFICIQGVPTSLESAKSNGLKLRNVFERSELRLRKDVSLRQKIAF